ncbi:hypothetical protein C8F04DRAFT_1214542 [Mycena alexandri]|uniref:Protein kinase domain-containing protein n=1 Tax=Mycena alexandri TaxID=1745969 RepID=A0AAD6S1N4_9AGAR|nr:hypothetical protein C8F04DRAFT_1214542 [Mycena alexandri]
MFGIAGFEKFEQAELEHPSPRKEIDGRFIYLSRHYELDVWNIGCVVRNLNLDLFEGRSVFFGIDPERGTYRGRAHLAEMIALICPPPSFVAQGALSYKFFSNQVPPPVSLEQLETNLEGTDRELFLQLMSKMLQWKPQNRLTPKQLVEDPWLKKHTSR